MTRWGTLVLVCVVGCSGPTATCTVGESRGCVCTDGSAGAQICQPDGTLGMCVCAAPNRDAGQEVDAGPGVDAGPDVDAGDDPCLGLALCGDRCVDTSTDEDNCGGCDDGTAAFVCDDGERCETSVCVGSAGCPAPFLVCDGECVDPRASSAYCGASGTCSGASAGQSCGGSACSDGRCVGANCDDLLARGFSTGNGVYLIDPDGGGPMGATEVYCDMTTDGGGWTLVYMVANNVPRVLDPWWAQIGLGTGTAFPTSPMPPASGSFVGASYTLRRQFFNAHTLTGGPETRAELVRGTTTLFDVRRILAATPRALSEGADTPPSSGTCRDGAIILANTIHPVFTVGMTGEVCDLSCSGGGCASSDDRAFFMVRGPTDQFQPLVGDTSMGPEYADTWTRIWIRSYR